MIEKVEYPNFHTFAEAVEYLGQGNWIDYEVKIGKHSGALLTRAEWLEAVESKSFIDYDGMGNQVDKDGNILHTGKFGDWIHPSEASELVPECAYILWYNR
jgi:hypothetical protein